MADFIAVNDEDDLWTALELVLSNPDQLRQERASYRNWRPRILYFPDAELGHSITPTIAKSIVGLHQSLCKSFAYLAYGHANSGLLRQEDRSALDIRMLVLDGSDLIEGVGKDIGRLVDSLVSKMSGRQVFALSLILLILYFSSTVAKDWIRGAHEEKSQEITASERLHLSEEETKRLDLVAKALSQHPEMKAVAEMAEQGREHLVRSALAGQRVQVLGVPVSPEEARVITTKPREASFGRRLDGIYDVVDINILNPDGFMGKLKNVATGQEIWVAINRSEVTDADIETLFSALRSKASVNALVNAWFQGDKVLSAAVVRANPVGSKDPPAAPHPSPVPPSSPPER